MGPKPSPAALAGAAVLGLLLLVAVGAPWVSPYDPKLSSAEPFAPPSAVHIFGANDIGQDILSELIWGSRVSLSIGILAALTGTAIGTVAGTVAGYAGGRIDAAIMRTADLVIVLPFLPLMIVLAAYVGPSVITLSIVIGVLVWARPARVIRSQILTLRQREYVAAARALGAGDFQILSRHLLGGTTPLAVAEFVQLASRAILLEAALAFLGLGDPVQKSWGTVLYYAQARGAFLTGSWIWWVLPSGALIIVTVLSLALVGMDIERRFNPRLGR